MRLPPKATQWFLLWMLVTLAAGVVHCADAVPSLINYQGCLTDQSGKPLAAGLYGIQFRLWSSASGTTSSDLIWGQQQEVLVSSNGTFATILGAPGGIPIPGEAGKVNDLAFAFGDPDRHLGITILSKEGVTLAGAREMLPRQQLLTVPYAAEARRARSADTVAASVAQYLSPPGSIIAFASTNIPVGWLPCDGRALSSKDYLPLYAAIGTTWGDGTTGVGSGSGSAADFNLPDLRGLFLRGINGDRRDGFADPDASQRVHPQSGEVLGNRVGSLQDDSFGAHEHFVMNQDSVMAGAPVSAGTYAAYMEHFDNSQDYEIKGTSTVADRGRSSRSGRNETRPKNAYVYYIIRF